MPYDGFISYSRSADSVLSSALAKALRRLAKPWFRRRALRIFRDLSDLSASTSLVEAIRSALIESDYFIYLASPEAATSPWVGQEIDIWLTHKSPDNILIVMTSGDVSWNSDTCDFDWEASTAIHPGLKAVFRYEPLWVDLRWAKHLDTRLHRHPRFLQATAMLAAPMHDKTLDDLVGEDLRQHRRTKMVIVITIVALSVLTAIAFSIALILQRSNEELDSKLSLVNTIAPFNFYSTYAPEQGSINPQAPVWTSTILEYYSRVKAAILPQVETEHWLEWQTRRVTLKGWCSRSDQSLDNDCDDKTYSYDKNGYRKDIDGLKNISETLVRNIKSGRYQKLSAKVSPAIHHNSLFPYADDVEDGQVQASIRALMPRKVWNELNNSLWPNADYGPDNEWHPGQEFFDLSRHLIDESGETELILIEVTDRSACGSAGCDNNLLIGLLNIHGNYELVLAVQPYTSGDIVLYEGAAGKMPKLLLLGRYQSGMSTQYRHITRLSLDDECICYTPELVGNIEAIDVDRNQDIPTLPR